MRVACGVANPSTKAGPGWVSHKVTASFGHSPAQMWMVPKRVLSWLKMDLWSTMDLHGLQRDSYPTTGCTMGCRGISLCFSDWSTSSLPSSLTLVSAVLFLPHVLIPVSHLLLHSSFFLLLTYIIPERLSPSLMCSALASSRSALELAGIGSAGTGKSSGSSSWKRPL